MAQPKGSESGNTGALHGLHCDEGVSADTVLLDELAQTPANSRTRMQ